MSSKNGHDPRLMPRRETRLERFWRYVSYAALVVVCALSWFGVIAFGQWVESLLLKGAP